jgi:hypothetical protein
MGATPRKAGSMIALAIVIFLIVCCQCAALWLR